MVRWNGWAGGAFARRQHRAAEPCGWVVMGRCEPVDRGARRERRKLRDRDFAWAGTVPAAAENDSRGAIGQRRDHLRGAGRGGTRNPRCAKGEVGGGIAGGAIYADDIGKWGARGVPIPAERAGKTGNGHTTERIAIWRLAFGVLRILGAMRAAGNASGEWKFRELQVPSASEFLADLVGGADGRGAAVGWLLGVRVFADEKAGPEESRVRAGGGGAQR